MRSLLDRLRAERDSVKEEHRAFLAELRALEAHLCLLERQCAELEAAMTEPPQVTPYHIAQGPIDGGLVERLEDAPVTLRIVAERRRAAPGERAAPLLELLRLRGDSWASPKELRFASGLSNVTLTNALAYLLAKGKAERRAVPGARDRFGNQRYEYRAAAAELEAAT